MANVKRTVGGVMVKSPITVEHWQPVAHARQLMLMHSFSYLPIRYENDWHLLSELHLARYLCTSNAQKAVRLGRTIAEAVRESPKLQLIKIDAAALLSADQAIEKLLNDAHHEQRPTLWLVIDKAQQDHLAGVLSPFELM